MHVFGKRLTALSMVMAILILGITLLPQDASAQSSDGRYDWFDADESASDEQTSWEQFFDDWIDYGGWTDFGQIFARPAPEPAAPTPAPESTPTQEPEPTQETAPTETDAAALDAMEAEVLNLINLHRQQNGLAPLSNNTTLNVVSYNHSLDMAQRGYFSHTNLEGLSPFDRMEEAGYVCGTMGENIAAGQTTAQQAFEGWMNSPGHNANMLNANYEAVGIGVVYVPDSPYGYYWTTDFGGC